MVIKYLQKHFELFAQLEKGSLLELTDKLKPETYFDGDLIMRRGDIGEFLMILYRGSVSIQVDGAELSRLNKNSLVGEAALKTRERRTADVMATAG